MTIWAGYLFLIGAALVVLFQLALAAGVPWGAYSNGGRFPGKLPPAMRAASVVNAAILVVIGLVIAKSAGVAELAALSVPSWAGWVVVGFCALTLVVNLITPSKGERAIWAPVAALMLFSSLVVTLSPSA